MLIQFMKNLCLQFMFRTYNQNMINFSLEQINQIDFRYFDFILEENINNATLESFFSC